MLDRHDEPVRTDFDPARVPAHDFYRLLTAVVVPRPIAWVSSVSADGVDNLAPHSFFTVACTEPPIVAFTSIGRKDSLNNIEAVGEFVVNLAGEPLFEQVNATGTSFPPGISEFDAVGVEREPSRLVRPWRVARSPVALECVLHSTIRLGNSVLVLGRVVHAVVDTDALAADGLPTIDRLQPLSRLGRDEWAGVGELREITRIRYREWPGHYATGPAAGEDEPEAPGDR